MKKIIVSLLLIIQISNLYSIELNVDMFSFDESQINIEFRELSRLEAAVTANLELSITDIRSICPNFCNPSTENTAGDLYELNSAKSSGNMVYFWTTFAISAVGTFFIYSAIAGPIAVAIIYFTTNKDIAKTKKAAWGCAAGTVLGAGLKFALSSR